MKRRDFIRFGSVAALAPWAKSLNVQAEPLPAPGAVREPARDLPVVGNADVVVCGGGPAGVAAALAAARKGAKTVLLEQHGCLGGIWTAGLLAYLLDVQNKSGIMAEIVKRMDSAGGRTYAPGGKPTETYDVEVMKLVLENLCQEAGVTLQLHTRVAAAVKTGSRLTHVITESKSGREAIVGKAFVDATGDGDLGALAGCGF
nr:FAD-dependent oxidoreductase [Kiritimatiellia bacterium]